MKKHKKIVSIILSVVMLISFGAITASAMPTAQSPFSASGCYDGTDCVHCCNCLPDDCCGCCNDDVTCTCVEWIPTPCDPVREPCTCRQGLMQSRYAPRLAFIIGAQGQDNPMFPAANMSRGEFATMLFRIMNSDARTRYFRQSLEAGGNNFADVNPGMWQHNGVSTLVAANLGGIFNDSAGGNFSPGEPVTINEFLAIAVPFLGIDAAGINSFYPSVWNGVRPANRPIQRAEAIAILLYMRNFSLDEYIPTNLQNGFGTLYSTVNPNVAMSPSAWYYRYFRAATTSYCVDIRVVDGVEVIRWERILSDAEGAFVLWTQAHGVSDAGGLATLNTNIATIIGGCHRGANGAFCNTCEGGYVSRLPCTDGDVCECGYYRCICECVCCECVCTCLTIVIRDEDGNPIPGATVTVTDSEGNEHVGTTCPEGTVVFPTFPYGDYEVDVTHEDFLPNEDEDRMPDSPKTKNMVLTARAPSVGIRKTVSSPTSAGGNLTYTLAVTNTGNVVLNGLVVTDTLPTQLQNPRNFVVPTGATYVVNGRNVTVTLATLEVGATARITFDVTVLEGTPFGTEIRNTATVTDPENPDVRAEYTARTTVQAQPRREAFLIGVATDGTPRPIRPYANITRAEVATIFFRLIEDDVRAEYWMQTNPFDDVALYQWFNNAISTTTNMGLFMGRSGNGDFAPRQYITRAELAAVLVRFMARDQLGQFELPQGGEDLFNDIDGHWAQAYINEAARQGWVRGRQGLGGPFIPNAEITRAETAAMINRMFERLIEAPECRLDGMVSWPDNRNEDSWYFLYMYMATNSYTYEWNGDFRDDDLRLKDLIEVFAPRAWDVLERPNSRPEDIFR